ncbi:MAG: RNA-dependent DNA polymerase [Leptolyngbya foveolarum]|uniref:RNA-dependent DNA polymerase n=1 Tax=Leptolyngbya foveolarum TaxID=47253 RepID=A0A2W4UIW2_9CYAN|nr:MAG: RNA-dependent DNA polymerase [Leptolyngbya foveolarum]
MVRHSLSASELWQKLPWKQFRRSLFRLQRRVYKAVRAGDGRKARSLQKLILKSTSARMMAIRQVTQLNTGKRTAGVDGKSSLTFKERFDLSNQLRQNVNNWRHQGLREIPIPKKNGKIRLLKVPTMADRAWQCLAKYALEPAHEATFHARSYGFRPGRSAHDAQKLLCLNLSLRVDGIKKRVIELDIEKCFDRINHRAIMKRLIAPSSLKLGIFRCLKAGVDAAFPDQGTPQGGVVSPLLANVALNGIEAIHPSVRYADDMVFFLKPQDDADAVLERVRHFLATRGMNISAEKTRVTASTDGFDFLGWHFKVQSNGKFKGKPSAANFKAFRQKVKHIVNHSNYGAKVKASKLAPIVRGWRNYHRYCKMRGNRHSLSAMRLRTYRVFNREPKQNRYTSSKLLAKAFPKVRCSENKHINVRGTKSPFDGDIAYWSQRNSKHYSGTTLRIIRKQGHRCGRCNLNLLASEKVELHHIDGDHNNWKGHNLLAVHQSCHDYVHMSKSDS